MLTPGQMLNLPKFSEWYPGQETIFAQLVDWMNGPNRFACAPIPTGFGKTLLGMLTGNWGGTRTAYITSTKGLQKQLMDDFNGIQLREILGRGSYTCNTHPIFYTDSAPCTFGVACDVKASCQYFSRLGQAREAPFVSANYAYWLYQHGYSDGISPVPSPHDAYDVTNPFKLLILDEGHTAARWVESYMRVELDAKEVDRLENHQGSWQSWQNVASAFHGPLRAEEAELKQEVEEYQGDPPTKLRSDYKWVRQLVAKLAKLVQAKDRWVPEEDHQGGMVFTPIDPRVHTGALFLDVPKVLIMSAVMTPRAAEELGVKNPTWIQPSSPFDPKRAPFTHIRTTRVDYRWTEVQKRKWVSQIDNILRTRRDRKGIIHTGSYERATIIHEYSKYQDQIITHTTQTTIQAVNRFKQSGPGTILVSPSVTTGYDFPGNECEFIIWGKIPRPFTNTPLAKARQELDKTWSDWEAMKSLVQGAGRGNRKASDICEVFIVDDHWEYFWKNRKSFAPKWFQERVQRSVDLIPTPLVRVDA